jgi:photosystem II stability/assembly factor-like uncharacterized protein
MRSLKISLLVFILSITVYSQNFWEQTSGPFGGSVLSFGENSIGQIFVGTRWDLVFISYDNGLSWTSSDSGFINPYFRPSIDEIAINDSDHIFVAGYGTGVYRSLDNGQSWEQLSNGMYRYDIFALTIDQDGFIYAGESGGPGPHILRSTDNGNSWENKSNGLGAYDEPYAFTVDEENNIYTATSIGSVFKTTDQAENWIQIFSNYNILFSISVCQEGYIFTGGWNDKIFRSTSGGNSWDTLVVSGDSEQIITSINTDLEGYIFAGTWGDPRFDKGVFRSGDNGESWEAVNNGLTDLSITSLFVDKGSNLYAGTESGSAFRSSDQGESWIQIGPIASQVNDIIIDENNIIFAGTENEVYRSTDLGLSWEYSSNGITSAGINSLAYNINGDIWAGADSYNGGIFRSTDKGNTWESGGINTIISSILCDDSGYVYVSVLGNLYRTTDDGNSWTIINFPASALLFITNDQIFYAGGGSGLYRSFDRGFNWVKIFNADITLTYIDHLGYIYAGNDGGGGLYRSTDDGISWDSIDNGFVSKRIKAINGKKNSGLYCAVGYGDQSGHYAYYASYNNGESWTEINSGISSAGVSLEFDSEGFLYAGTTNRGVYRSIETTVIVEKLNNLPQKYILHQNYPNPFNPVTSIKYVVGSFQFVSIKVYDVLGNEIATLVNEEKLAGEYEVEFNATNLPSGIYFYQLKAGDYTETRKMVLLK